MGEVINLRVARKQRARADASARADQNRQLFGRTAAEKTRDASEHARIEATLDGARLETPEPYNPGQ